MKADISLKRLFVRFVDVELLTAVQAQIENIAFPGMGALLGGATTVVTAAAGTYATGMVFTHHFEQGGTLLDFDPVKSRAFFQREFDVGEGWWPLIWMR